MEALVYRHHLQRLALVSALLIAACSGIAQPIEPTEPGVTNPSTPAPVPSVDWQDSGTRITFDEAGYTVSACPGDSLHLCVEHEGREIGTVEATAHPIASFDGLDPTDPPEDNLRVYADRYFTAFETDRAQGCGADYGFESAPAEPFDLGGTAGISFGFRGTWPDGSPSELNLQYATVVDDHFVAITAVAYDDDGCLGRDVVNNFRSNDLDEFRPYLEELLNASPLPPVLG